MSHICNRAPDLTCTIQVLENTVHKDKFIGTNKYNQILQGKINVKKKRVKTVMEKQGGCTHKATIWKVRQDEWIYIQRI